MTAPAPTSRRFEIVRCMGEGGMGIVYEALDRERGTRVALKTLRHMTPDSLARLKREFRAMQDVHHENLASLGELVSEGDQVFFTMELVDGPDFLQYVRSAPRPSFAEAPPMDSDEHPIGFAATVPFLRAPDFIGFDEPRLRETLRQLTSALVALHGAGLVHRDVKPSNVRVTREGRVVLLDFGLVVDLESPSMTTLQVAGTPAYMAPEQAASGVIGPEADWYALGVMLYETLTGSVPFTGTPLQVMMRKQGQSPPRPASVVVDVPPDLDELCEGLLRFDPASRPSGAAVQRALGHTSAARSAPSASHSQATPFVGRGAETEALGSAFQDSRQGRPVSVIVQGESGMGKTSLVRRFTERLVLEDPEVVVLTGRCYERESVPYKAFDGVVDALARFLSRLPTAAARQLVPTKPMPLLKVFPVLRRVEAIAEMGRGPQPALDPFELRSRAFSALRELLVRLADRRRLVIVIDDAQWADADSVALLGEVMRLPDAPPLLLVLTVRTSAGQSADASVDQSAALAGALQGDVRVVQIGRLPDEDARALAARLLERVGVRDEAAAEWCAKQALGHPLFIDMMTRQAAPTSDDAPVMGLEDALWGVIKQLDAGARALLEVVAIAGTPIPQTIAAKAAEQGGVDFARTVSMLRVAHLVHTAGARGHDRIEPYHDRVRSAALAHMDDKLRRERHRRIALAFETSGDVDPEALVVHWRGAGDLEQAARCAVLAGDRAIETLAFDRATRFYMLALSSQMPPGEDRRLLTEKLGEACANAGRGKRAADAFLSATEGANPARSVELRRRAAEQLLRSGHFDEGLALALAVVRQVGMWMPTSPLLGVLLLLVLRFWLTLRGHGFRERDASLVPADDLTRVDMWWSLSFSLAVTDTVQGANANAQHVLFALRIGEPRRVARALAQEAGFHALAGGPVRRQSRTLFSRARAIADRFEDPNTIAYVDVVEGISNYLRGSFAQALVLFERAEEMFSTRCVGVAWELDTTHLFAVNSLAQLGRLSDVTRRAERHLREAAFRGDLYAAVNLRVGFANLRWLAADDPDSAQRDVVDAMAEWSKKGVHLEHFYELMALTNVDLYVGRGREALARFDSIWPALRKSLLPWRVQSVRIFCRGMRGRGALASLGAPGRATEELLGAATQDAEAIAAEAMAWSTPLAQMLRAGVAWARQDQAGAIKSLRTAAKGFEVADMDLHAAVARRTLGRMLGGDEGRGLVEAADVWMSSQGIRNQERITAMLAPGFRANS